MNKTALTSITLAAASCLLLPLALILPAALVAAAVQASQNLCPATPINADAADPDDTDPDGTDVAETAPPDSRTESASSAVTSAKLPAGAVEVRTAAARYFPPGQLDMAVAVAGAESGYRAAATHTNRNGSTDYGLWQINSIHHDLLTGRDWRDPDQNAWMAYQVWTGAGRSWDPWSTFTSGTYRRFLHHTTPAVSTSTTELDPRGCAIGGGPRNVTLATWNACLCNTTEQAVAGVRAVAAVADIIGLQEFGDDSRRAAVARAVAASHAMTTDQTAVPILYNTARFDAVRQGRVQAFGPARVETGVNGTQVGPKWVTWVVLRDKNTATQFAVINTHMLPSVNRRGHPDLDKPLRLAKYAQQLHAVLALADRFAVDHTFVMVTGDFNVDYSDDARVRDPTGPFATMIRHGFRANWQLGEQPTQGHRTIDDVWSTTPPASQTVLTNKHGSDHAPVIVHFTASSTENKTGTEGSASVARVRTVTDPSSHRTYRVPIPYGPAGVVISAALDQLGKPYVWGAHGPTAFDCSGLTAWAWRKAGITITPQSSAQHDQLPAATGPPIPGDIWWHPGHVQLFLGVINGQTLVVEAPNPRARVRIIKEWMRPQAKLRPTSPSRR